MRTFVLVLGIPEKVIYVKLLFFGENRLKIALFVSVVYERPLITYKVLEFRICKDEINFQFLLKYVMQ